MGSNVTDPANTQDSFMPHSGEELQAALDDAIARKSLPRYLNAKDARAAFQSAFELIGGVPRLAVWADKNPTQFYSIYARLIQTNGTNLPPAINLQFGWANGRDTSGKGQLPYDPGPTDAEYRESGKDSNPEPGE